MINRGKDFHKCVKNHTGWYVAVGGDQLGCNHMSRMGWVNWLVCQIVQVWDWARYTKGNPDIYPPFKGTVSRCALGSRCFWVCLVEGGDELF